MIAHRETQFALYLQTYRKNLAGRYTVHVERVDWKRTEPGLPQVWFKWGLWDKEEFYEASGTTHTRRAAIKSVVGCLRAALKEGSLRDE